MGVRIIATGVDAEQYASEYSSPVVRGLEAIFFENTSLSKVSHNYVPAKPSGTIVGTPLPTSSATTFKSQSNYVMTDVSETDSMTWFIVARSELDGTNQSSRAVFLGNYDSTQNPPGSGMYIQNTNRIAGFGCFGVDAGSNALISSSVNSTKVVTDWNLYAVIVQAGGVTMHNLTTNQTGVVANANPRRKGTGKIRIGSSITTYTGQCDIAVGQLHSVTLTETEIQTVAADLRAYVLRKGLTV